MKSVWIFSASFFLSLAAEAASIERFNETTISLSGRITKGDAQAFSKLLDKSATTIRVKSQGGDAEEALKIARIIYKNQLDIEVDKGCISSCANYLFPAARNKTILRDAILGFHGTLQLTALAGEDEIRKSLESTGMSKTEIDKSLKEVMAHAENLAEKEVIFARDLKIKQDFYLDFKDVSESVQVANNEGMDLELLWWPSAKTLKECYGIDHVVDHARPEKLDKEKYVIDPKHSFLLVGNHFSSKCK